MKPPALFYFLLRTAPARKSRPGAPTRPDNSEAPAPMADACGRQSPKATALATFVPAPRHRWPFAPHERHAKCGSAAMAHAAAAVLNGTVEMATWRVSGLKRGGRRLRAMEGPAFEPGAVAVLRRA